MTSPARLRWQLPAPFLAAALLLGPAAAFAQFPRSAAAAAPTPGALEEPVGDAYAGTSVAFLSQTVYLGGTGAGGEEPR